MQNWSLLHKIHLLLFWLGISGFIHAQDVELITHIMGIGNENITSVINIRGNNVLIGGDFTKEITISGHTSESNGSRDIFLLHTDQKGTVLDKITFGSADNDDLLFLSPIGTDSFLMAGHYYDRISFGNDTLISTVGSKTVFLSIVGSNLEPLYSEKIESSRGIALLDLDVNFEKSVTLTIQFENDLVFLQDSIKSQNNQGLCILSWKYPSSEWTYHLFESTGSIGVSKTIQSASELMCAGTFTGSLHKDSLSISTATNDADVFYYFNSASQENLFRFGGVLNQNMVEMVMDHSGKKWLVGSLEGVMQAGELSIQSQGFQPNIFLVRIDQQIPTMAWSLGNTDFERAYSARWADDKLWILGYFEDDLGIGQPKTSRGSSDIFVISLDSIGQLIDEYQIGDEATEVNPIGLISDDLIVGYPFKGNSETIVESTTQDFDVAVVSISDLTGIQEIPLEPFLIYPNPATDAITVESLHGFWTKGMIYDSSGKLVKEFEESTFNIQELNSGIFFVKVQLTNGKHLVTKFLKQ